MKGKKTKLKKIELTSVDMVRRGANQEAYINLYKSAGDPAVPNAPSDDPEGPNTGEIPQSLWKSIVEAVKGFIKAETSLEDKPEDDEEENEIEKAAETFESRMSQQEIRDNRWKYQDALNMSIDSIISDNDLSNDEKVEMMNQSVDQFAAAYKDMCAKLATLTNKNNSTETSGIDKSQEDLSHESEEEDSKEPEEGEKEMKIDKSRFTPEELEQYQALIAKGCVDDDPEIKKEEEEPEIEEEEEEMHPEVKKALDEMKAITKSLEMQEMTNIAKKYAPLGKKEDELAKTLYEMKKSSPSTFDTYIAALDQNLELVNKSGIFEEIGKSGSFGGYTSIKKSEPEAKIEAIAKSYQEKDPSMDYDTAIMKAWENHPELMDEYDAIY